MDISGEQLGVGGAVLVTIVSLIMRRRPPSSAPAEKSGDKPPEYWRMVFRDAAKEGIREAMLGRNEELRRIMREEFAEALKQSRRPAK